MKVAVVHDWFKANGGAEKVAGAILDIYKNEDVTVFTLFNKFNKKDKEEILKNYKIKTSILQNIPFIAKIYRFLLPIMPWAMNRFYISGFDVIISTSHAVAKGFRSDGALHICYCHTPMRYIWDMYDDYAAHHSLGKSYLYKIFIEYLRQWDYNSAKKVNSFIANSKHVQKRIATHYGQSSKVIYPPVRVDKFQLSVLPRQDFFLCLGRFVPYKKIDMVIRAFQLLPDKKLILIGDGYGTKQFKTLLREYPNITWLGYKPDTIMIQYIQQAKACIFAAKEDFGIMCVEVQACGTPVIALDYGGYQETVIKDVTGYFFENQEEQSLIDTIHLFESKPLTQHELIRKHALKYSDKRFHDEMESFVASSLKDFHKNK